MFKLLIEDTNVASGSIPVSWYLSENTLNWLYESNCTNPYIVISIVPNKSGHQERRFIAPLKDLMMYISFYTSGCNKIFSYIVYDNVQAKSYLEKDNSGYYYSFVDLNNQDYCNGYDLNRISEIITVNVHNDCFAKEPAQWEKDWVNFWFRYPAEDQCEFRRRRIIAYTIQPIAIFLFYTALFIFAICAYLFLNTINILILNKNLFRAINPFYFFNDLNDPDVIMPSISNSIIYPEFGIRTFKDYFKLCLIPMVFIPILVIGYLIFKYVPIIPSLIIIFGFFAFTVVCLIYNFCDHFVNKKYEAEIKTKYWLLNNECAKLVIRDMEPKVTKISELPSKNQTIKLMYQQLKSKVCKPFSGE